jgi:hypothetical protein
MGKAIFRTGIISTRARASIKTCQMLSLRSVSQPVLKDHTTILVSIMGTDIITAAATGLWHCHYSRHCGV